MTSDNFGQFRIQRFILENVLIFSKKRSTEIDKVKIWHAFVFFSLIYLKKFPNAQCYAEYKNENLGKQPLTTKSEIEFF